MLAYCLCNLADIPQKDNKSHLIFMKDYKTRGITHTDESCTIRPVTCIKTEKMTMMLAKGFSFKHFQSILVSSPSKTL